MAIISVLTSNQGSQHLIRGVFGRFDGEKLHIDPLLQRIYLFSLQKELPVEESDVSGFDLPAHHVNAAKANLTAMMQRHWSDLYESRAPLAGSLQGMVRAEQAQVNHHCQTIIQDLDVGNPVDTRVIIQAHITSPDQVAAGRYCDDDDYDDGDPVITVDACRLQRYAESAAIDDSIQDAQESSGSAGGLDAADMDAGQPYNLSMSMNLPLHGDNDQRKLFVEKFLPTLMRSGLLETIPSRVLDYQQADQNEESQRFGSA